MQSQPGNDGSSILREIRVTELTQDTFAPFGQIIAPMEDGVAFGAMDAQLVLDRGTPRFYIMKLAGKGLTFRQITRHRQVTQCLASVGGGEWYIGLAPPGDVNDPDSKPLLDDIRAFKIPGDTAIKLHVGTWHAGPFFVGDSMSFFNLELVDTNVSDHQSCFLDLEYGISFRFV